MLREALHLPGRAACEGAELSSKGLGFDRRSSAHILDVLSYLNGNIACRGAIRQSTGHVGVGGREAGQPLNWVLGSPVRAIPMN